MILSEWFDFDYRDNIDSDGDDVMVMIMMMSAHDSDLVGLFLAGSTIWTGNPTHPLLSISHMLSRKLFHNR